MLGIEIDDLGMVAIFMALILFFMAIAVWLFTYKRSEKDMNGGKNIAPYHSFRSEIDDKLHYE